MENISGIRKKVKELGELIDARNDILIVRTTPDGFGSPHIEIRDNTYHFIISERGAENVHNKTKDINQLLYWIFNPIIFEIAIEYELDNREEGVDFRKMIFSKELELMGKIKPLWRQWKAKEIEEILKENPYNNKLYK